MLLPDLASYRRPYKCPYEGCEHATAQKAALNLHITAIQ